MARQAMIQFPRLVSIGATQNQKYSMREISNYLLCVHDCSAAHARGVVLERQKRQKIRAAKATPLFSRSW